MAVRERWFGNRRGRPQGRPPSANPKVSTTIRLSRDVIDRFRAGGRGWQTRIDAALREWIAKHDVA